MIDIQKLAKLTGIQISSDEEKTLGSQLESVVGLLEKVKNYDIEQPSQTWHELLGLQSTPQQNAIPDGNATALIENVDHTIVGHAIEVKAFVE